MHAAPEPDDETFLAAVATARVVLGPHVSVQAPPNLADPAQRSAAPRRGDQRLGRGLARHPRPREPGTAVAADRGPRGDDRGARRRPAGAARDLSALRRRAPTPGSPARMRAPVAALTGPDGLAVEGQRPDADRAGRTRRSPGSPARSTSRSRRRRAPGSARTPSMVYGTLRGERGPRHRRRWARRARRPGAARPRGRATRSAAPPRGVRSPTPTRSRCSAPRARASTRLLRRGRRPARRGGRPRGHLRDQPEHQLHERLLRGMPVLRVRPARGRPGVLHA